MLKKIKQMTVVLASIFALGMPAMVPALAHADTIQDKLCEGINKTTGAADGTSCTNQSEDDSINKIIKAIINIFSLVVGFVSVIMIIVGGFKYITSGGDSGNVTGAKNTIMYAIIGLVIVALAQVIVRFVLTKSIGAA
jgi:hypothetical protein